MDKREVLKLANLARIEISDDEAESLTHEFESILQYVGEVKQAVVAHNSMGKGDFPVRNIMRDDDLSHETGIYTEDLLNQAPSREGSYIKVKKIL